MIVVTANWGIADGTLVRTATAWQPRLVATMHRAVVREGFRRDGSYRPVDAVDIVVAGDAFDWLVSAAWRGRRRPWHGGAAVADTLREVASRSLRSGRRVVGELARWARRGLPVPAADARQRPASLRVRVPVRVTLLAGDRDAALAGLPRPTRLPISVGEAWLNGRVAIRHGHDLDPACHRDGDAPVDFRRDRPPTLAESVAVDLVAAFAATVTADGCPAGPRLVRALAAARALDLPPVFADWRRSFLDGGGSVDVATRLVASWRRAVDAWTITARRVVPSCEAEFDAVDALAGWFATAGATPFPMELPAGLGRLGVDPAAVPETVVTGHGWGGPDGREPPVAVLHASETATRLLPLGDHDRPAAVVAIGAPAVDRDHGGTIVDAA